MTKYTHGPIACSPASPSSASPRAATTMTMQWPTTNAAVETTAEQAVETHGPPSDSDASDDGLQEHGGFMVGDDCRLPEPEAEYTNGSGRTVGDDRQRCEDGEWVVTGTVPPPTTAPPTTAPPTTVPAPPLVFDGSGSTVLDLGVTLDQAKLLQASNEGDSNFQIEEGKTEQLEDVEFLVNEIGPVSGLYPLNMRDSGGSNTWRSMPRVLGTWRSCR